MSFLLTWGAFPSRSESIIRNPMSLNPGFLFGVKGSTADFQTAHAEIPPPHQGDSKKYAKEAISLFREVGQRWWEAVVLRTLADWSQTQPPTILQAWRAWWATPKQLVALGRSVI